MGSITPVLRIPVGLMLPHCQPLVCGAGSVFDHTTVPSDWFRA